MIGRALRAVARVGSSRSTGMGGGYVPAAPVLSGTYVTPQTALGLAPVFAAINVISRDIASLPLGVYEKLPGGGFRLDETVPQAELLSVSPNGELNAQRYRQATMGHVLGHGNGYSEIVRDSRGTPIALHPLHPQKTKPKRTDGTNRLYYELDNKKKLLPENVLHFAGLGFDGLLGYSPITVCRQTVGLAIGAEQFGASFFGNGAVAKGIIKIAKKLSEAGLNNLRRSINEVHQTSANAHNFLLLEEGMSYEQTQIAPDDAQWILTRGFQVLEIARIYSIPPHKIGDYSQAHMTNVEEANLDYISTTIAGWLAMLEAELNMKLLTAEDRKRWVIRHDLSALMRGNTQARGTYYQTLRNLGAINADEIRSREGMNPVGPEKGGDLYLVQAQYQQLKDAGRPLPKPKGAPDKPAPEGPPEPTPDANEEPEPVATAA